MTVCVLMIVFVQYSPYTAQQNLCRKITIIGGRSKFHSIRTYEKEVFVGKGLKPLVS